MFPKYHIIINLAVSLVLLSFLPYYFVLIFFFSSILIDSDHYFYYVIEEKNFSLKKAYKWFSRKHSYLLRLSKEEKKKHKAPFFIFHGIEMLAILFAISKFFYPVFFVMLGFSAHLIEDGFDRAIRGIFLRKLFLSYGLYKHFKLKLKIPKF